MILQGESPVVGLRKPSVRRKTVKGNDQAAGSEEPVLRLQLTKRGEEEEKHHRTAGMAQARPGVFPAHLCHYPGSQTLVCSPPTSPEIRQAQLQLLPGFISGDIVGGRASFILREEKKNSVRTTAVSDIQLWEKGILETAKWVGDRDRFPG